MEISLRGVVATALLWAVASSADPAKQAEDAALLDSSQMLPQTSKQREAAYTTQVPQQNASIA